jgi:Tol biopolymer transport system component
MLALSPDGRALAFVASDPDGRDRLYLRSMDLLESRALAGTEGAAYPFWSPDGRSLAFFADGKLKRIEASGGGARTLCDAPNPRGGSWGVLGSIVFSAEAGGQIEAVSGDGGPPRPLGMLASRSGATRRWPSFLPDGRHFLYVQLAGSETEDGLHLASLDGSGPRRVAAADSGAFYASSGHLLYRMGDRLVTLRFDLGGLAARGEPVPIVEDVWWDGTSTLATAFTVSSGGVLAYQTGGPRVTRLIVYDRTGREVGTVGPSGPYYEPTLSPDGRRLAVARAEGRGSAIWVMDVDRGTFGRVSSASASTATPVWMPDGRRVLYSVFPTGEVYSRDADAAEPPKLLFKRSEFSPIDDVSPDGRSLLFESVNWPTFHFDVAIHDLATGAERPLLKEPFNENGARLSPDGRWLAYESDESGTREIVVRSFPDLRERRRVSAGGGTQPRWRRDGRELFYMSPDRKLMAAAVRTAAGFEADPPRALFQTRVMPTVETRNHYDTAPDGQRFVINSSRPEDAALPITVVVNWSAGVAGKGR